MNGPYVPDAWPGGCQCWDCRQDFTPGQQMREKLLALDRDVTIVAPLCDPCFELLPKTATAHV